MSLSPHLLFPPTFAHMKIPHLVLLASLTLSSLGKAAEAEQPLVNFSAQGAELRFVPSSGQVTTAATQNPAGVEVKVAPGNEGYPGVRIQPEDGKNWDLSNNGHVEATITNTGDKAISLSLRVDNKANGAESNTEGVSLKPGATGTATVIFGYSYGKKPGYALRPSEVGGVLIFTTKSKDPLSFRIESLKAAGPSGEKPPFDPNSVRIQPQDGNLLGHGVPVEADKQIVAKDGAQASLAGEVLTVSFPTGKGGQSVAFKPPMGRWDLRQAVEVRVVVKNTGATPITPKIQVQSNGGPTDVATAKQPIAAGAEGEIVASFIPTTPWLGIKDSLKTSWNGQPGTGTKFTSDTVSSINILPDAAAGAQSMEVKAITAGVGQPQPLPEWVGKRPPVDGDWVQTLNEEFDGGALDASLWNVTGENYYDKRSHYSKDNVIVGDGVATLRYEKKTGFHNDDPARKQTEFATGFLDTYGKWVQRYGYFEARMKLTKGPGMWPAFWLMPDRGAALGPQWKRSDTKNGAMEFDIMEFLGRWGQYRYNIAMHWDGYGKEHQQTGCTTIYFQPDKDGYITAGLLWLPGLAVYYANGREVLRWESPRISSVQADIMFTNVTGGWDNDGIDEKKMPDDFKIDYVRVWQRKDLASDVDGKQTAPAPTPTPVPTPTPTPQPAAQ